ncbi:hypothetical protein [Herbidospora sp. RD11066]
MYADVHEIHDGNAWSVVEEIQGIGLVDAARTGKHTTLVRNTGAVTVYLGGSDVTAATGYPLEPGEQIQFTLSRQFVWAIAGTGDTGEVRVLMHWE